MNPQKDIPHILPSQAQGVHCKCFGENWLCHIHTTLYLHHYLHHRIGNVILIKFSSLASLKVVKRQLSVQPVMKFSSKWQHFRFNVVWRYNSHIEISHSTPDFLLAMFNRDIWQGHGSLLHGVSIYINMAGHVSNHDLCLAWMDTIMWHINDGNVEYA